MNKEELKSKLQLQLDDIQDVIYALPSLREHMLSYQIYKEKCNIGMRSNLIFYIKELFYFFAEYRIRKKRVSLEKKKAELKSDLMSLDPFKPLILDDMAKFEDDICEICSSTICNWKLHIKRK